MLASLFMRTFIDFKNVLMIKSQAVYTYMYVKHNKKSLM